MYPGPDDPDLGRLRRQPRAGAGRPRPRARARGRRRRAGGDGAAPRLARDAVRAARRFRPDVVYAHFLVPAGPRRRARARGRRSSSPRTARTSERRRDPRRRAPRPATSSAARPRSSPSPSGCDAQLVDAIPEAAPKIEVVDCGVDLERFAPRDAAEARAEVGWSGDGTAFLCLGSLSERKNVLRLARAFERRGEGRLTFVGDGPLREGLEGRERVRLVGRVAHECRPDVARGLRRPVPAEPRRAVRPGDTRGDGRGALGGGDAGRRARRSSSRPRPAALVDPEDEGALVEALDSAALLPRPNLAARAAAEAHDVRLRRAGWSRFSSEPLEVGEPDLDERPDGRPRALPPAPPRAPPRRSRAPSPGRRPA